MIGLTTPKFNQPDSFQFDKPADWPEWKQRFLRFRSATKLDRKTSTVQVSSLVYAMGREAEKIYSSFQLATTVPAAAAGANAAAICRCCRRGSQCRQLRPRDEAVQCLLHPQAQRYPRARKVSPARATSRRERRKLLQISDGTVGDVRLQGQKQGDSR